MSGRKLAALSAGAVLLVLFLLANSPRELSRRAAFLARSASLELAARRLGGSGAAFDRNFFIFLETLSRQLPRDVVGVAIFTPRPSPEALHLASYALAPVPVVMNPARVPPRWLGAVYDLPPPPGFRILAQLPRGALLARP
ncbi:MAG TPA: hypothetical protein VGS98_17035 [Thermoanaerobaculia bacterium]|nr:hypothetical protein [Thermoanaerobaculia bacterium]